jgi:hypothetical protein
MGNEIVQTSKSKESNIYLFKVTTHSVNYRCPARAPATIETIKSTIMQATMIFWVEVFIWNFAPASSILNRHCQLLCYIFSDFWLLFLSMTSLLFGFNLYFQNVTVIMDRQFIKLIYNNELSFRRGRLWQQEIFLNKIFLL